MAAQGAGVFYRGEIARDIVARVRGHAGNPGLLDEADLAGYRAIERTPLCFDHRRWRLCGMPPPSSGTLAVGQMLGMLETRGIEALRPRPAPWGLEPDAQAVHLFSEAGRLAFADRARYVADPDFAPLPGLGAATLLDPHYLQQRAALIGPRSMGRAAAGTPLGPQMSLADDRSPELASTTQVSVVDGFGHALSMTSTIENGFGAQIMVRGFLLNNQLTDFSFVPAVDGVPVANRVQGGKRPRSAMAPMLVFEREGGRLVMSIGSPGGPAIINHVAKALVASLDWELDLQQAVALPNFGSRNGPTELEAGRSSSALADALRSRGHEVQVQAQTSGLQGIRRVDKCRLVRRGRPAPRGHRCGRLTRGAQAVSRASISDCSHRADCEGIAGGHCGWWRRPIATRPVHQTSLPLPGSTTGPMWPGGISTGGGASSCRWIALVSGKAWTRCSMIGSASGGAMICLLRGRRTALPAGGSALERGMGAQAGCRPPE